METGIKSHFLLVSNTILDAIPAPWFSEFDQEAREIEGKRPRLGR